MSQVARNLLLKLLAQADRGGRVTLPINERSAKTYFDVSDLSGRDAIHAYLANAQMAGGLTLEWGTGAAKQDLKRLRISDADRLAQWLGVPRSGDNARRIDARLGPMLANAPAWLQEAYTYALKQWRMGHLAFRIPATDISSATHLFQTALAVSAGEQTALDLRRFSARLLGDSKAVERLLGKLAELLRQNTEWSQIEDNGELFRLLGLEKFPPPLFIKGPLLINYGETHWDISELRPFVGLSPDEVRNLDHTRPVPYLLTIENLASFQRHVREIEDGGIVIYTAGFPAPALIRVLQRLDKHLPSDCSFFHWGDRDIGGLRIYSKLDDALSNHPIHPHLMMETQVGESTFSNKDRYQLELYAEQSGPAGALARLWLDICVGPMEQELIDPGSPETSGD